MESQELGRITGEMEQIKRILREISDSLKELVRLYRVDNR